MDSLSSNSPSSVIEANDAFRWASSVVFWDGKSDTSVA
jgi:hypothetical protein